MIILPLTIFQHKAKDEQGTALVQMILTIPLIMVVAVFLIQFAIFNYEVATISSQISRAIVATDLRDLVQKVAGGGTHVSQNEVASELANRIRENTPAFDSSSSSEDFWISDFEINTANVKDINKTATQLGATTEQRNRSLINNIRDMSTDIEVKGTLHYKMPAMYSYSVFDNMELTRNIDVVQTGSARFEISQ